MRLTVTILQIEDRQKSFDYELQASYFSNSITIIMLRASQIESHPKKTFLSISMVGAVRAISGLPIEHPFETLKTWMQSENQTPSQAARSIYQAKHLKGFYSGFWVNCLRAVSKAAYRWPLTVYIISKFRKECKQKGWGIGMAGAGAGIVTATLESIILCPLERLKTWVMTSSNNSSYNLFWKFLKSRNLYDGFQPVLTKQMLSWVSFLGTQEYLKQLMYRYLEKDQHQYELNLKELTVVSLLVCLINTIFVMPADYIKTHYQKYGSKQARSMWQFSLRAYQLKGIAGFYRGGAVKMVHYNINAMLTVPLMQKLLRATEEH